MKNFEITPIAYANIGSLYKIDFVMYSTLAGVHAKKSKLG